MGGYSDSIAGPEKVARLKLGERRNESPSPIPRIFRRMAITDSNRHIRTHTHCMAGVGGQQPPQCRSNMSPTIKSGRHDQKNLPLPVPFPCR